MIRFLNVYYPTRTVLLLLSEAAIVSGCFLLATWIMLRDDTYIALQYEHGILKIAVITIVSLILSYYFDLYEPSIVSGRLQIYFRILLVLGFDCFILSAFLAIDPQVAIGSYVYVLGFGLLAPALILLRRSYEWVIGHKMFRERVFVLGAGEYARSIVDAIRLRPDLGMEVVEWYDKGGHPNKNPDAKIVKLNLTPQEKTDLVSFLKACTGSFPKVQRDRLP